MTKIHLLVVEDNWEVRAHLAGSITNNGHACDRSMIAAPMADKKNIVDFVSLDVSRPSERVRRLYLRLREASHEASHGESEALRMPAAESGQTTPPVESFEEVVPQPLDLADLVRHIQTALQQNVVEMVSGTRQEPDIEGAWRFCDHAFYPSRRYLRSPSGARISLTCAEADLLTALCRNARKVVSREELITFIHGTAVDVPKRSIDILISRLRRKLSTEDPLADFIRTIRTGGYIFQPQTEYG
ncbi:winged helix-turn-helix domain-containing protein [Labrys okinawensis]|uniref:winged helix-turn-helix domain-containing protein n=1 Tax=Labrys okinawensis TaxID=346911 RepID=UPI0039BC4545